MMKSHSWLIIVTVAVLATVSYVEAKIGAVPMADDIRLNRMLASSTTEENEIEMDAPKRDKKLPLADDPRFNKMLPKRHFDMIEKNILTPVRQKLDKSKVKPSTTSTASPGGNKEDYYDDDELYYDDYENETDDNLQPSEKKPNVSTKIVAKKTTAAPIIISSQPSKKTTTTVSSVSSNSLSEDISDESDSDLSDDDSDEDDDDDIDDDDEDDDDDLIDSEGAGCMPGCICHRRKNQFVSARCNRFNQDLFDTKTFSDAVTDLEIVDIPVARPIVLKENFFIKLGLKGLSTIKMTNVTITYIHPQAFAGLSELYSVNLTNAGIEEIGTFTFHDNKKLHLLTLAGNNLRKSQEHNAPIVYSKTIEELDLSNCNLKTLQPKAFEGLENIMYINLANNDLQTLPEKVFSGIDTIEELNLSSNNISSLPRDVFANTSLAILTLSYNSIKSNLDFGTNKLQKLDLSFNKISHVTGQMFQTMPNLSTLILKGNFLKKVDRLALYELKDLRQIDLSFNSLEQISSQIFFGNRHLDSIRLNDNSGLKKLPLDGFEVEGGVFDVYLVDVSNCDISELGDNTFARMNSLTTLNLAWNNIESITKDLLSPLAKLTELNLSNNLITELDDLVFLQNRNLKKLNLAGNSLTKLSPKIFLTTRELLELDVSDCDLEELWSEPIQSMELYSTTLKNLQLLNISTNNIKHARHTHFQTMDKLQVLDLSNNPLHCDEGFHQLIDWLHTKKIKPGHLHTGFNAEMRIAGVVIEPKQSLNWTSFENQTCTLAHLEHEHADSVLPEEIYDSDDASEEDSEEEIPIDDTKDDAKLSPSTIKPISSTQKTSNNVESSSSSSESSMSESDESGDLSDDDSYDDDDDDDELDDEDEDEDEGDEENEIELDDRSQDDLSKNSDDVQKILLGQYGYLIPMLIILAAVLAILLLIAKFVALMMHRRGERYRQALLASKNSIIYQKLSEEINAPQTPKIHRYSPISQV